VGNIYKDFWATAAQSTVQHVALHPYNHPELTFISQGDAAGNLEWQMDDFVSIEASHVPYSWKDPDHYNSLALQEAIFCWEGLSSTCQKSEIWV
jgi:mannosyl-oligosaccharide alpha-1,2-mannosidase